MSDSMRERKLFAAYSDEELLHFQRELADRIRERGLTTPTDARTALAELKAAWRYLHVEAPGEDYINAVARMENAIDTLAAAETETQQAESKAQSEIVFWERKVHTAEADAQRLREALTLVQWKGWNAFRLGVCSTCGNSPEHGHQESCEIGAALRPDAPAPPPTQPATETRRACHCGSEACVGAHTLRAGFVCVRETGLQALRAQNEASQPESTNCAVEPEVPATVPIATLRALSEQWKQEASKLLKRGWLQSIRRDAIERCAADLDRLLAGD